MGTIEYYENNINLLLVALKILVGGYPDTEARFVTLTNDYSRLTPEEKYKVINDVDIALDYNKRQMKKLLEIN